MKKMNITMGVCALLHYKLFASKSHTRKSDGKKLIKKDSHHCFTPKAFPILQTKNAATRFVAHNTLGTHGQVTL